MTRLVASLLALLAVGSCPGDDPRVNPKRLWLSLIGGNERMVQLVPVEPEPF